MIQEQTHSHNDNGRHADSNAPLTTPGDSGPDTRTEIRPLLPVYAEGIIPRVAAFHDICGYGNCSLGIAMPVISAAGVEVCPVPTSVLSAHTAFPVFSFLDTTSTLPDFLRSWKELNVKMDGLYTGFLGSSEQIELIIAYIKLFPESYRIIDPVMGDHGIRYATYTEAMCDGMKRLIPYADVLMPNLTEAAILLDRPYTGQAISQAQGQELCESLLAKGARHVILKGIHRDYTIYNAIMSSDIPYTEIPNEMHPTSLHGTGDLFASVVTAALFSGHKLPEAVTFAADLVYRAICLSVSQPGFQERGVSYEPLIGSIVQFCMG